MCEYSRGGSICRRKGSIINEEEEEDMRERPPAEMERCQSFEGQQLPQLMLQAPPTIHCVVGAAGGAVLRQKSEIRDSSIPVPDFLQPSTSQTSQEDSALLCETLAGDGTFQRCCSHTGLCTGLTSSCSRLKLVWREENPSTPLAILGALSAALPGCCRRLLPRR